MSRIYRERVVGKSSEELDELTCSICFELLTDPVVAKCCGQTFCAVCIHTWIRDKHTCPIDRSRLNANGLMAAPKIVTNMLGNLKMICKNHLFGCETTLTIEEIEKHEKTCAKNCKSCNQLNQTIDKTNNEVKDLKKQLSEMQNKVKELTQKNEQMEISPQNKLTKQRIVLDQARKNLSQYAILEEDEIEKPLVQSFIALAQNAIKSYDNFNELVTTLKEKMDARNGSDWSIVAYSDSGDTNWWVTYDKKLIVDFCGLKIEAYLNTEDDEEDEWTDDS